jgi:hypothetical protein
VDGTRRLPDSPLIDTYLVPEAPQGRVAPDTAPGRHHRPSATRSRNSLDNRSYIDRTGGKLLARMNESFVNALAGDACRKNTDCRDSRLRCDAQVCECFWGYGLNGRDCDALTASTAWSLLDRGLQVLVFAAVSTVYTALFVWFWYDRNSFWLKLSQLFCTAGSVLVALTAVDSILTIASVLVVDIETNSMQYTTLHGIGLGLANLGFLSVAILWIEIARLSHSLNSVHGRLSRIKAVLIGYLCCGLIWLPFVVAISSGRPQLGVQLIAGTSALSSVANIICFGCGAQSLSAESLKTLQASMNCQGRESGSSPMDSLEDSELAPEEEKKRKPSALLSHLRRPGALVQFFTDSNSSDTAAHDEMADGSVSISGTARRPRRQRSDESMAHGNESSSRPIAIWVSRVRCAALRVLILQFVQLAGLCGFFFGSVRHSRPIYYMSSMTAHVSFGCALMVVAHYMYETHRQVVARGNALRALSGILRTSIFSSQFCSRRTTVRVALSRIERSGTGGSRPASRPASRPVTPSPTKGRGTRGTSGNALPVHSA